MCNQDIRAEIKAAGIHYWQVAEKYGCTDGNFSRKLRRELPEPCKARIRAIIAELKGEKVQ